jgi:DNA-binding CsgD family transcriptional regulator
MPTLKLFSEQLAKLIPTVGSAEFPTALVEFLGELTQFDDVTILLYPGTDLPVIEYFTVSEATGTSTLDPFAKGTFLLDPYYLAATRDRQFGVFCLRDLSPTGFRDSEYYKLWYRNCGYQDECGFLIPLTGDGFANIALGKTTKRARFSKREVAALASAFPTIAALCQRHWADAGREKADIDLRGQLHAALNAFGSSLLTDRETQVINLVLHGHSTRTLAEKLSISTETVKLHRKHAYAKLEVSSQAELFYLFLDSLMSASDYVGGDTLVRYMQSPRHGQEHRE